MAKPSFLIVLKDVKLRHSTAISLYDIHMHEDDPDLQSGA